MRENSLMIRVENVKKQYRLGQIGGGTLRGDLQSWWARKRGKEDPNTVIGTDQRLIGTTFMALNGVSFTVNKGEAVGIIGRNGAGKSTLLKLLTHVTAPTSGDIDLYGRVASMLEVGTGFHPEMTGRENVYLNGAILGMTRAEIDAKMAEIIEFSEVRRLYRHARQALFQRHVRQVGILRCRPSGQRDHDHGRGPRRRRHEVPAKMPEQDERCCPARRQHRPLRQPQHGDDPPTV